MLRGTAENALLLTRLAVCSVRCTNGPCSLYYMAYDLGCSILLRGNVTIGLKRKCGPPLKTTSNYAMSRIVTEFVYTVGRYYHCKMSLWRDWFE